MINLRCGECERLKTMYGNAVCVLNGDPLCQTHFNGRMRDVGQIITQLLETLGLLESPEAHEIREALRRDHEDK